MRECANYLDRGSIAAECKDCIVSRPVLRGEPGAMTGRFGEQYVERDFCFLECFRRFLAKPRASARSGIHDQKDSGELHD